MMINQLRNRLKIIKKYRNKSNKMKEIMIILKELSNLNKLIRIKNNNKKYK